MENKKYFFAFVFISFIIGCSRKGYIFKESKVQSNVKLHEAKLFDIPFPLNYSLLTSTEDDKFISLSVFNKSESIVSFYKDEMFNLGWKKLATFESPTQHCLVFEKPYKFILVLIRYKNNHSQVDIFIKLKNEESSFN